MNKRLLIAISLAAATTFAHAQTPQLSMKPPVVACAPATKAEYIALSGAIGLNKKDLVLSLLSKYCYDLSQYEKQQMAVPFFFVPDVQMLQLFVERGIDVSRYVLPKTQMDLLSHLLVRSEVSPPMSANDKQEVINILKKYDSRISLKDFDTPLAFGRGGKDISKQKNNDIIKYVAQLTAKNYSFDVPKDKAWKNTALHYAVMMNNADTLDILLKDKYVKDAMFKRNSMGLAPIHMAFMDRPNATPEEKRRTNAILIDLLDKSSVSKLFFKNASFMEFIEVNQNQNPALYEAIKAKVPTKLDKMKVEVARNIVKSASFYNYIETLKKWEMD